MPEQSLMKGNDGNDKSSGQYIANDASDYIAPDKGSYTDVSRENGPCWRHAQGLKIFLLTQKDPEEIPETYDPVSRRNRLYR